MSESIKINNSILQIAIGDITDLNIDAFVYYAQHNLNVGSGFGTAISTRGGPSIQEELKSFGSINTTEAVITTAGNLKANYIIHAAGPRFLESELEQKLKQTILNVFKQAEGKEIKKIAFPPMGTGFYGIPLQTSAAVMLTTIRDYLTKTNQIEEVVICLLDRREYNAFHKQFVSRDAA